MNDWFVERTACPGCESPEGRVRYAEAYGGTALGRAVERYYATYGGAEPAYLEGAEYVLVECAACTLLYQREVPGPVLSERLYERWIAPEPRRAAHARSEDLAHLAWYAQEIMTVIAFLGRAAVDLKVFDYGLGWGRWCAMAKAFGCDTSGTELSTSRIENARALGIRVIDAERIAGAGFDFINTEQVLEHVPDPLATLRRLARGLAPSGLVKVSVPNGSGIAARLARLDFRAPDVFDRWNPIAPLEHLNAFNPRALARMAAAAGLEEVKLPLRLQYAYATRWWPLRPLARNLARPLYMNLLDRGTWRFYRARRAA